MIAIPDHDDPDLVPAPSACPNCGERHIDKLVWIDDVTVRCSGCGEEYLPMKDDLPES